MQPLGRAACNPNITSIIRTPITKNKFQTNSFLIPWRNVKYFEIWTVFIDFVNDDNLFRIVVIKMFLPKTNSYSAWVFLAVILRLQWAFWIIQKLSGSVVTRVLPEPDRSAFDLSPGISGAFNALPICNNRAGHLYLTDCEAHLEKWNHLGPLFSDSSHTSTQDEHTCGDWLFMVLHLLIYDSFNHHMGIWCNDQMCQLAIIMDISHLETL